MMNFYVKVSKESKEIKEVMEQIKELYAYRFVKKSDTEFEFSADSYRICNLNDLSLDTESEISVLIFDTDFGAATKKVFNCGYLTSDKNIIFNHDTEVELVEKSNDTDCDFYSLLDNMIENLAKELSELPTENSFISIDSDLSDDEDLIEWINNKPLNKFKVQNIDFKSGLLWVEDCDFGIKINICKEITQ